MGMKLTLALIAAAAFMAPGFCAQDERVEGTAEKSPVSSRRLPSMSIEQYGVYNAAAEISEKAKFAIGVAAIQRPELEPTIKLNFSGGTVADLLNSLVSEAPDYEWRETERNVIHLSRNGPRVSLLDVVMSYPGAAKKTRQQIWDDLGQRPEILAWLESNHCRRSEVFTGHEFRDHNAPISIASESITVEQFLDQVAITSGTNYWAVLQSRSGNSCQVGIMLW
jgi:hypothetical protein